ncbi:MAG: heme exporter protein CcmD [Nevskia sp.]|jgi:heme exporter protein CcmD|nr:heme exporter protein CcmD [Nevskia sp.]MCK9384580.1 heme exporter protein CcmD [Nevskia sp.]
MNPKYAFFIWSSYALTALVLLWNLISPALTRKALLNKISAGNGDPESDE